MKQNRVVMLLLVALSVSVLAGGCRPAAKRKPWIEAPAEVRIGAARQLVLARDSMSAPSLVLALDDPEPTVRRLAIYGLERIGDQENARAIIPLLKDEEVWVQRTAATALGKLRSRKAVRPLVRALSDDDVHVRLEAFVALGRIADPSSQKAILKAMRDPRIWQEPGLWDQMSVVHVLSKPFFTDSKAVGVLKWLLTYSQWEHPGFADLEPSRRERFSMIIANRAAQILANKFGDASGEQFLIDGVLVEGDDYIHQDSAKALGELKSTKAVPVLAKMLGSECIGDRAALAKIDGKKRESDLSEPPAAKYPEIAAGELKTPGGKRPPQFICLGVDDCANIEGIESMLDIVETLARHGQKVCFTMWVSPLAGEPEGRDMLKQKLIYQRLFDTGSEVAHHTLHHNPGGHNWRSLPKEQQIEEIEGCTQWYRDNIAGFTRPFSHKGGGGGRGASIDREFSRQLLQKQKFLYRGRRGQHPNDQQWPPAKADTYTIQTGCLDSNAPPVHEKITDKITSDYPGRFDFDMEQGLAMWMANFEYHYNHPQRPILAVNAFHDWGFKSFDDSTAKGSHRNEARLLKEFLLDVLVRHRDKYPDTYVVTYRQVVEYAASGGDLEHTLAAGNCQDSRKAVKPVIK